MTNNALIKLLTKQTVDGDEPVTLEIVTEGVFEKTENGFKLTYDEPDEEMKGCVSTLVVNSPTHVTMTRSGSFNSQLDIEKGVRRNCLYDTPYGSMMMGIFASEIRIEEKNNSTELFMKYTVDFNAAMVSENCITVQIKEL